MWIVENSALKYKSNKSNTVGKSTLRVWQAWWDPGALSDFQLNFFEDCLIAVPGSWHRLGFSVLHWGLALLSSSLFTLLSPPG